MRLFDRTSIVFAAAFFAFSTLAGQQVLAQPATATTAIGGSVNPAVGTDTGHFTSASMEIEVVLSPSNEADLSSLLTNLYDPSSATYRHWLNKGEFYSRYAPSQAQIAAVTAQVEASGLTVEASSSPFLVRASGPSSAVEQAFQTTLHNYSNARGVAYFSNATPALFPTSMAAGVRGVVGLNNTIRLHSGARRQSGQTSQVASCQAPYPTAAQLFAYYNSNVLFPDGYGGGPGCSGLTPSQVNSIYGAPNVGPSGKGTGVTLGLFELSAYKHSDIETWAHEFYGYPFTPPLTDITVDGGPLHRRCPMDDSCPAEYNFYAGDIEVDADIEASLAIAPLVSNILVYNAPNDYTGQTSLDEYVQIANDDKADVVSASWGVCENDVSSSYALAENLIFEQMAAQGQSMFSSAGDTGAFDCIGSDATTIVNVEDPASQPWVTSVGGTSFESFNPATNPAPAYPAGIETVWNVDGLCNARAHEGGQTGFYWCNANGAGGGGSSQYWGLPSYQHGPGIINAYTAYGNGTTNCALANVGQPCREVPDISANADEYTGYAEYCTGDASTRNSGCVFSAEETPAGWFGIGGTSLSSPIWSAIIGDQDGYLNGRLGNANPLLYLLYNANAAGFFHDITGEGQTTKNNGLYPTTPGYDLATGIGTPKMGALITLVPQ